MQARNLVPLLLILSAACWMPTPAQEPKSHPDLPDEFKQLVSRGYIPAIDDPQFVGASEAEIDDEGWVLGVVLDGQAKAYSLNLLNRHEVVNDRFGDRPVAAVW